MTLLSYNIAITRGHQDASEFAGVIHAEGGRALTLPTIRLVARNDISGRYMQAYEEYDPDYTIFMSSRAVGLLMDDATCHGISDKVRLAVANGVVVAVGPKTADALEKHGIRVNMMPQSTYSSVGVGEVMSRMDRTRNRVLVPRSGASTPFLKELLQKEGFDVREEYMYDVEPWPGGPEWNEFAAMLGSGDIHGMVFTSASSVRAFFDIMHDITESVSLEGVCVVSIGPFTSEELVRFGVEHTTSNTHTVPGSLDLLRHILK